MLPMKKYNYPFFTLLVVALAWFTFSGCQTSTHGVFLDGSLGHITRTAEFGGQLTLGIIIDGAQVASLKKDQNLRWHLVSRGARHNSPRNWPESFCHGEKDCYGTSGADLQLHCNVGREALSAGMSVAIASHCWRRRGEIQAKFRRLGTFTGEG